MRVHVKVNPNSKVEKIEKVDDKYLLCFKVVPEKGKANKKVIEMLSDYFDVPKSNIAIVRGQKTKEKLVEITK